MILDSYKVYNGQHCETTAIGGLLQYEGLKLSEPLLFGIGSGLGFIYWNMKSMPVPFLGGRSKELVATLCKHLNIQLEVKETSSLKKAWVNVKNNIEAGHPVGLQVDCYHLEYFTQKIHFAGHHLSMYGFDESDAFLNDTFPQGGLVTTSLKNLSLARSEKGPMSAKNKSYYISSIPSDIDLKSAILQGIKKNMKEYLSPPITNIGYKGIRKTSIEIKKWLKNSPNPASDFHHTAIMMEKAGTGGALFRNLYRDFLLEAYNLLQIDALNTAHLSFKEIAKKWSDVSSLFMKYSETEDELCINEASSILTWLSQAEYEACQELLQTIS